MNIPLVPSVLVMLCEKAVDAKMQKSNNSLMNEFVFVFIFKTNKAYLYVYTSIG